MLSKERREKTTDEEVEQLKKRVKKLEEKIKAIKKQIGNFQKTK